MPGVVAGREEEICGIWRELFQVARRRKSHYLQMGAECDRYYRGPHDFVFHERADVPPPTYEMTVNKVYEYVRVFSPLVYSDDPRRAVYLQAAGVPEIARILKTWLNYAPREYGLKYHSRRAVEEALIHGRGILFTSVYRQTGHPMTRALDSKDVFIDPSADTWYGGDFIMHIERDVPIWKVGREYGWGVAQRLLDAGATARTTAGYLAGDQQKSVFSSGIDAAYDAARVTYAVIYSKMGIGLRAKKTDQFEFGADGEDFVKLVIEPEQRLLLAVTPWEIPFWADYGKSSWPYSMFDPAERLDPVWPMAPVEPGLGEQRFLDWAYSFVMGKVRITSRSVGLADARIPDEFIESLKGNEDVELTKISEYDPELIPNIVHWMEMPEIQPSLLTVLELVEDRFERATGLREVMQGETQRAYRSATEAEIKGQFSKLRPEDMMGAAEDWQSSVARKEAIGAKWLLEPEDLLPLVGPKLAAIWGVYRPGDLQAIIREYSYEVVAGSMRKKTPQFQLEVAEKLLGRLAPVHMEVGNLEGVNFLIKGYVEALGVSEVQRYLLPGLPPAATAGEGGPETGGPAGAPTGGPAGGGPPAVQQVVDGRLVFEGDNGQAAGASPPPEGGPPGV